MNLILIRIILKLLAENINSSLYWGFYLLDNDFSKYWKNSRSISFWPNSKTIWQNKNKWVFRKWLTDLFQVKDPNGFLWLELSPLVQDSQQRMWSHIQLNALLQKWSLWDEIQLERSFSRCCNRGGCSWSSGTHCWFVSSDLQQVASISQIRISQPKSFH